MPEDKKNEEITESTEEAVEEAANAQADKPNSNAAESTTDVTTGRLERLESLLKETEAGKKEEDSKPAEKPQQKREPEEKEDEVSDVEALRAEVQELREFRESQRKETLGGGVDSYIESLGVSNGVYRKMLSNTVSVKGDKFGRLTDKDRERIDAMVQEVPELTKETSGAGASPDNKPDSVLEVPDTPSARWMRRLMGSSKVRIKGGE